MKYDIDLTFALLGFILKLNGKLKILDFAPFSLLASIIRTCMLMRLAPIISILSSCIFLYLSPNMANTVNAALKPLETLSRIVNQPSSLFGSKSASSKNKSEQDAQGASQDSSSHQQDPGRESE
jgi:hypothetical protein